MPIDRPLFKAYFVNFWRLGSLEIILSKILARLRFVSLYYPALCIPTPMFISTGS